MKQNAYVIFYVLRVTCYVLCVTSGAENETSDEQRGGMDEQNQKTKSRSQVATYTYTADEHGIVQESSAKHDRQTHTRSVRLHNSPDAIRDGGRIQNIVSFYETGALLGG